MKKLKNMQTYKMNLKTIYPVYIGGGEDCKLSKLQYYFHKESQKFCIIDEQKFARFLVKKGLLDSFVEFVKSEKNPQLWQWFKNKDLKITPQIDIFSTISSIKAQPRELNDVRLFIKNSNGNPFIPGSSIKGAIRTALLHSYIMQNKEMLSSKYWNNLKQALISGNKHNCSNIIANIEKDAFSLGKFNTKEIDSIFRGLSISDSKEIDKKYLYLSKKEDLAANGQKPKGLPLYREYLKPFVDVKFLITIDKNIFPYTIEEILSQLSGFTKFQDELIRNHYDNLDVSEIYIPLDETENAPLPNLCLGGGSGYLTKTIVYSIAPSFKDAKDTIAQFLDKAFRKKPAHNHVERDTKISPRALKLVKDNGDYLCIGWCNLSVAEGK